MFTIMSTPSPTPVPTIEPVPVFPLVIIVPVALLLTILFCIFIEFQMRSVTEFPSVLNGPVRKRKHNNVSLEESVEEHEIDINGKAYKIEMNRVNGLNSKWSQLNVC